jgi:hypothetical protein
LPATTSGQPPPRPDRALTKPAETDPGLGRIIDAWPTLPELIRKAMLALVESGKPPDLPGSL